MDSYYNIEQEQVPEQPAYKDLITTIDENGHLTEADLYGVQTKIFNITMPDGVTLEQLQVNNKSGAYWEIPTEMKNMLKHVKKIQNRTHASEEDLEGDVSKALFLGATVISHYNNGPIDLAIDIDGLVPTVFTDKGRHNWVIPANCSEVIKESIFEPNNYFTRFMYEHNQKCDLKTLNDHIRLDYDPKKQIATMDSLGVGWAVLTKNLHKPSFAEIAGDIRAKNQHIFENPNEQHIAVVPYEVASVIHDAIAEPLREIEKSYTDFYNLRARWTRADKEPWNSIKGLVKDAMVFGNDSVAFEQDQKLSTPIKAGLKLKVKYVLN
jgi:hypothetical protein